ncbi:MAG: hypothetical protein AABP62_04625 [Planctomycetota bacterium]
MSRQTYLERRWPSTPLFQDVAIRWCADQSRVLLGYVWSGFDRLLQDDLNKVPFSKNHEAKEESLNFLLAGRINQCLGAAPFWFCHQPPETTKRKRGKGKSPTPDYGFVLYDFPKSVWPLEGKVLKHERDVGAYLTEVNDNFLTGRYATFSKEGAMVGYLLEGDSDVMFDQIERRLTVALNPHTHFSDRPHRVSIHIRKAQTARSSLTEFACHHLVLRIPSP